METPYVALSYVWGKNNFPVTLNSNKGTFHEEGSLRNILPLTIAHTIELVQSLGFEYLWVDSLCITQDDLKEKDLLINAMDVIYQSADLTIVAATGTHSQFGLSGYDHGDHNNIVVRKLPSGDTVGFVPYFEREMMDCDHARRGWS
jgi:hypothetical protein